MTHTNQTANDLRNPATSLGKQFVQLVQGFVQSLQQQGLPPALAQKAAAGKAIGQIMAHQFPLNFVASINDAYFVTFWLAVLAAMLALALPGRPRQTQAEAAPQADGASQAVAAQPQT